MRWLDVALQLVLPPVQNNAVTQAKIRSVFYHTRSSFSAIAFKENGSCSYFFRSINSYGCTLSAAFVYDKKTFDVWMMHFYVPSFLIRSFPPLYTHMHTNTGSCTCLFMLLFILPSPQSQYRSRDGERERERDRAGWRYGTLRRKKNI